MKFNFASLLLSSTLSISLASASSIKLSDAYHGLVPEEISMDKGKLKGYQEKVISKFEQKLHHLLSMQEQIERFYAPYSRKGGEHQRVMANAVCDFVEAKIKKVNLIKILYEGHLGEAKDYLGMAAQMQGQPPSVGHHAALMRKIKDINLEIENVQTSIKSQPAQKTTWEQEIEAKNQTIQKLEQELKILDKQKFGSEEALQKQQELLDANQEEIRKEERILGECSAAIQEFKNEYQEKKAFLISSLKPIAREEPSEAHGSQEKPAEELNQEQIDPALQQQLTALEAESEAKEKELTEKKGLSYASATDLRGKREVLQQQKETLAKEKETFEQELQDKEEQISTEKREIELIEGKIKSQAEEQKNFEAQLKQLLLDKKQQQDEADIYALIKYLTLFNIYSALPNADFDYHGYENPLTTLSLDALPTILSFINKRADQVGRENVKLALDREMPKFQATVDSHIASLGTSLLEDKIVETAENQCLGYNDDSRTKLSKVAASVFRALKPGAGVVARYNTSYTDKYYYYPSHLKEIEFPTFYSSELDSLRADHQIKVLMTKWRDKISTEQDSLIRRLGLDSVLFNPDFSITSYPQFLSFSELQTSLEGTFLVPYPVRVKEKDVWSFARMQLRVNYFEAINGKDDRTWRRISPVVRFVESKLAQPSFSRGPLAPQEEVKQEGFKHLLELNQGKAVEYAYLKYISYVNMLYALSHNGEGSEMPPLKIIDPAVESLIRDALPSEIRLDNVMAAKAYKWGQKFQKCGKEFIKQNGLEAHFFTPVFEDKNN